MKKCFLIVLMVLCAVVALVPLSVYAAPSCLYSLSISPNPIAFSAQDPGTPSGPLAVTIRNNSTEYSLGACSSVTGITVGESGDMLDVFSIDSENCDSLSRGASCTANMIFTPAAEGGVYRHLYS